MFQEQNILLISSAYMVIATPLAGYNNTCFENMYLIQVFVYGNGVRFLVYNY